ncbi:hypothetical protein KQX54_019250 [Cotesia glomerata]|uniref:Uncharacterized protein n=1 Tax=Cotesia glomerata TaxID=32391 RepID=A0AAV7IJP1_COTGL|nr:hypothetical protein KQX54_019250 [Cotesia glomerata]
MSLMVDSYVSIRHKDVVVCGRLGCAGRKDIKEASVVWDKLNYVTGSCRRRIVVVERNEMKAVEYDDVTVMGDCLQATVKARLLDFSKAYMYQFPNHHDTLKFNSNSKTTLDPALERAYKFQFLLASCFEIIYTHFGSVEFERVVSPYLDNPSKKINPGIGDQGIEF